MSETQQAIIRRHALRERRDLTAEQRRVYSDQVTSQFIHSPYFFRAKRIAVYLSTNDEVDTSGLIQRSWRAKKKIFTPVLTGSGLMEFREMGPRTTLRKNCFGIPEPVDGDSIDTRLLDIIIAPVVAFDAQWNRVGMGGGFYDRCLSFQKRASAWRKPKVVGLAFRCQQVDEISRNPWDISLCEVLSERESA